MKFTLHGFSQTAAKKLGVDYIDLCILRWFTDLKNTGKMVSIEHNGETYYWVNYVKFTEEYTIFDIKKDAVYKRFRKMCEKHILKRITVKCRGTYSYFAFSTNYRPLLDYKVHFKNEKKQEKDFCEQEYESLVNDVNYEYEMIDDMDYYCLDNDEQKFEEESDAYEFIKIRGKEVEDASTPLDVFQEENEIIEEQVYANIKENDINTNRTKKKTNNYTTNQVKEKNNNSTINQAGINKKLNNKYTKADCGQIQIDQKPVQIDRNQTEIDQKPEQIINLPNKSTKIKNISVETLDEYRLGEFLYQNILKNNPHAKMPNFKNWAKTFDLMIRIDHRKPEEIVDMICWVHTPGNFWNSVILCPKSLRKYYDRLFLKRKLEESTFLKNGYCKNLRNGADYEVFD